MVRIGENRKQAALRFGGVVVYYLLMFTVGWIVAILMVFAMLADLLWQLVTDGDGLTNESLPGRVFERQQRLREWLLFGTGDGPSTPKRLKR
jgi:hypothetical protein